MCCQKSESPEESSEEDDKVRLTRNVYHSTSNVSVDAQSDTESDDDSDGSAPNTTVLSSADDELEKKQDVISATGSCCTRSTSFTSVLLCFLFFCFFMALMT